MGNGVDSVKMEDTWWKSLRAQVQVSKLVPNGPDIRTWGDISQGFDYHTKNKLIAPFIHSVLSYSLLQWIDLIHSFPTIYNIWGVRKQKMATLIKFSEN